jgi:hypothetical protein
MPVNVRATERTTMDSNLESTIITVKSVEDMGSRLKLKGSDNKSYTLWKNKKDGNATVAYQNWQNFKVGDTVKVGFKSEPPHGRS